MPYVPKYINVVIVCVSFGSSTFLFHFFWLLFAQHYLLILVVKNQKVYAETFMIDKRHRKTFVQKCYLSELSY